MDKYCNSNVSGNVPNANWNRDDRQANLGGNDPRNRNENYGARAAVKDYVFRDFVQPPSILPISSNLACAWKILVSLAISSSKHNLSFKVATSR